MNKKTDDQLVKKSVGHITWRQLRALKDNYIYLLTDDVAHQAAVIDPGEAAPVRDFLTKKNYDLSAIFITHHHSDHVGGVMQLLHDYQCPLFAPQYDLSRNRIPHLPVPPPIGVKGGDQLEWQGLQISVIDLPGHTLGHVGFLSGAVETTNGKIQHWFFSGDVIFSLGCGYLFEGSYEQAWATLKAIKNLPDDTLLFMGHEYSAANIAFAKKFFADNPSNSDNAKAVFAERIDAIKKARIHDQSTVPVPLAVERATNPFLQLTSGAAFRHLREAKNNFSA